jgi:hypothetical protein
VTTGSCSARPARRSGSYLPRAASRTAGNRSSAPRTRMTHRSSTPARVAESREEDADIVACGQVETVDPAIHLPVIARPRRVDGFHVLGWLLADIDVRKGHPSGSTSSAGPGRLRSRARMPRVRSQPQIRRRRRTGVPG